MNRILWFAAAALAAGCASFDGRGLVPGQSTVAEVEALMGPVAEKRPGAGGETVYWYPRFPYGYESYAARIGADGKLVALEQRLTGENIEKVKPGATRDQVRDLLGPPWQPMKMPLKDEEIWTYPLRVRGYLEEQWFLVHFAWPDGPVRTTYLIDAGKALSPNPPPP